MQDELKWWLHAIPNAINDINITQVDFEICTNVSEGVWEATDDVNAIGGDLVYTWWSQSYKLSGIVSNKTCSSKLQKNVGKQHIQVKSDIQHYSYSLCK